MGLNGLNDGLETVMPALSGLFLCALLTLFRRLSQRGTFRPPPSRQASGVHGQWNHREGGHQVEEGAVRNHGIPKQGAKHRLLEVHGEVDVAAKPSEDDGARQPAEQPEHEDWSQVRQAGHGDQKRRGRRSADQTCSKQMVDAKVNSRASQSRNAITRRRSSCTRPSGIAR